MKGKLAFRAAFLLLTLGALPAQAQQIVLEPVKAGELILFRDLTDEKSYYYVSDKPRLAMTADGKPEFSFLRWVENVRTGAGEPEAREGEGGGIFHCLVTLAITPAQIQQAQAELQKLRPGGRIKGPVMYRQGTFGLVSSFKDPAGKLVTQVVGLGKAPLLDGEEAAVSFQLTKRGAQILWESVQTPTPDISFTFEMELAGFRPPARATLEADFDQIYKHKNFAAGFASAQFGAEIEATFDDLRRTGSIKLTEIGTDADLHTLISTAYSQISKIMFEAAPDILNPGGMPGGMAGGAGGMGGGDSMLSRATQLLAASRASAKAENEGTPAVAPVGAVTPRPAVTPAPTPRPVVAVATPTPAVASPVPVATPKPAVASPVPVATPTPAAPSPAPVTTPKPAVASPAPVTTPKPGAASPAPVATPKPAVASPAPVTTPKPVASSPAPVATPKPVASSPAPVASPKPVAASPVPGATPAPAATPKPAEKKELPTWAAVASFKMKSVRQSGKMKWDLNKYTESQITLRFDGNLGDVRQYRDHFREVNLWSPLYQQREVVVYVDGMNANDFGQYINFVTVRLHKRHASGAVTDDEVLIDRNNFNKENNRFKLLYGWKGDDDRKRWMDYEYQTVWSFFGGKSVEMPMQKATAQAIPVAPPYQRRTVELRADPSELAKSEVRSVTVKLFYDLAGTPQVKHATLEAAPADAAKPQPSQIEFMSPPENVDYEYEITWRLRGNRSVSSGRQKGSGAILYVDEVPSTVVGSLQ